MTIAIHPIATLRVIYSLDGENRYEHTLYLQRL